MKVEQWIRLISFITPIPPAHILSMTDSNQKVKYFMQKTDCFSVFLQSCDNSINVFHDFPVSCQYGLFCTAYPVHQPILEMKARISIHVCRRVLCTYQSHYFQRQILNDAGQRPMAMSNIYSSQGLVSTPAR